MAYSLPPPPPSEDALIQAWLFELYKRNSVLVDVDTATLLSGLSDTTILGVGSGELLKWDGSAWINNTLAEAGVQPLATVLTNTTASFLIADETKLDGIEALADVTDATNVLASLVGQDLVVAGFTSTGIDDNATTTALTLSAAENATFAKDVSLTDGTFNPLGPVATADGAAFGYTATGGAQITGQGTVDDVSLINDAGLKALSIPTGTQNVEVEGDLILGNTQAVQNGSQNGVLYFSGGNAFNDGGYMYAHGSTHATLAGDLRLGSNGNNFLVWDEAGGIFILGTGNGAKTTALTISAFQEATFAGLLNATNSFNVSDSGSALINIQANSGVAGISMFSSGTNDGNLDFFSSFALKGRIKGMDNSSMVFSTGGSNTTALVLNSDQSVDITNHIGFPVTDVPSAGANDMDDYEEGDWTPTLRDAAGDTATTNIQTGR